MKLLGKLIRNNTVLKTWRILFVIGLMLAVSLFAGCASTPEEGEPEAVTPAEENEPEATPVEENEPVSAAPEDCPDCKCPDVLDDRNETKVLHFDNLRDYRYAEILLSCGDAGTGIFNTIGLNNEKDPRDSCPEELFVNFSAADVEKQYNSPMVWMNGPRHWTMDSMDLAWSTKVRNLDGLDTRWGADIVVPEGANLSEAENAYIATPVQSDRTWFFDKGKPVFIMDDSNNNTTYVMQSYGLLVDESLTYDGLETLDTRLELPEGWSYRVEVLDENLTMNGVGTDGTDWQITQDSLQNTYSACLVKDGQTTCNFQP